MAKVLIPVTQRGLEIASASQNYVEIQQFLESINTEDNASINITIYSIIQKLLSKLEQKLQQQINVEKAMRNAGINLENIFNQNSIGEKAIYDESVKTKINQEKILNKTKQAKKNVEKEVQSVNQKQKKIYETLEGSWIRSSRTIPIPI